MGKPLLQGIRVLDLTMAYAGPIGTRVWADMGAELIKVESLQRIDMPVRKISFAENTPGDEPWNRGGYFHRLNVNKYGITLDLNNPKGLEIIKRLVKISDIVSENYSPRVMKNFGLDYEALKQIKPDIIMVSMSGFGQTGPYRDYAAYVPVMESAGLGAISGYTGDQMDAFAELIPKPSTKEWADWISEKWGEGIPFMSGTGYGDWLLGTTGAAAVLAALHYRRRTGKGQHIDVAGREAIISHIGEAVVDYSMNQRRTQRAGNRHRFMAPHGCYRCQGDDKWVTIAVRTEEEWHNLCKAMGNPDWAKEERFSNTLSRWNNQDELDKHIEEWTKEQGHYEIMHHLQQAGVPAGAALDPKEVIFDPHLKERKFFQIVDQGVGIGRRPQPMQMAAKFSECPISPLKASPRLGEDNEYVLGKLLGMSKEELTQLAAEEIIGTTPPQSGEKEMVIPLEFGAQAGALRLDPDYLEQLSNFYGENIGPSANEAQAAP